MSAVRRGGKRREAWSASCPLAQLAERLILDQKVPGSIPGGAIHKTLPLTHKASAKSRGFVCLRSVGITPEGKREVSL